MRIIVDAFGGDNAPDEIMKGCEMAYDEYGYEIVLVGDEDKIKQVSEKENIDISSMEIIDAPGVISMEDDPSEILKSKKDSSMYIGLENLADDNGDAFISAGNSGALVVGATMIVKRIKGISRCAFAPVIPKNKGAFMLIDSGANSDCRPEMLMQFGIMGSIYMEKVMKIHNPRVALANIGIEDYKGDILRQNAFDLILNSGVNFMGNIEARDIPDDVADVVVTDGFTGNIILKLYEGMACLLFGKFKEILSKNIKTKLAASLILSDIKRMKKEIDYNEYGGAPLIGIRKPVFKAHGDSEALTIKNSIRLTGQYVSQRVVRTISEELKSKIN